MKAIYGVCTLIAAVLLAGCPPKDKKDKKSTRATASTAIKTESPATTSSTGTATASSTGSAALKPETVTKPPIVARIKAEVDGKEPEAGYTGTKLTVAGSKGEFAAPAAWDTAGQSSASKDQKAGFHALSAGDTPNDKSQLDAAAAALGLTDCEWGTAEAVTLGKDKVAASVADGVCVRSGTIVVRTGYAAIAGEDYKLLAMGRWDDAGGDAKGVFDTFRSLTKAADGPGKPGGVAACCAIIKQNMANAPPDQQGAYAMALGACQAAAAGGLPMSPAFSGYCK